MVGVGVITLMPLPLRNEGFCLSCLCFAFRWIGLISSDLGGKNKQTTRHTA